MKNGISGGNAHSGDQNAKINPQRMSDSAHRKYAAHDHIAATNLTKEHFLPVKLTPITGKINRTAVALVTVSDANLMKQKKQLRLAKDKLAKYKNISPANVQNTPVPTAEIASGAPDPLIKDEGEPRMAMAKDKDISTANVGVRQANVRNTPVSTAEIANDAPDPLMKDEKQLRLAKDKLAKYKNISPA
ncbi:MAG: hypothetical protein LBT64_02160, partial [Puniceicoccales bacterium]|nr:hypothetical protein [Puniceicoccales bacterium]